MDTKLATTQIRIQQWAVIVKNRHESGLKVEDDREQHGLSCNDICTGYTDLIPALYPLSSKCYRLN